MRRHRVKMVLAGATAVWCAAPLAVSAAPVAGAVARAGTWRTAIEVPGLGSLNRGGYAEVHSVSCASAGNCAAGGVYKDSFGHLQVVVVSEENGSVGQPSRGPGPGGLKQGGRARPPPPEPRLLPRPLPRPAPDPRRTLDQPLVPTPLHAELPESRLAYVCTDGSMGRRFQCTSMRP